MKRNLALLAVGVLVLGGGLAAWTLMGSGLGGKRPSTGAAESANATADAGGPIVEVRMPSTLSPEARIGKRIFEAKCAACHGDDAGGRQGKAPPLVHRYYRPDHHGDAAFLLAARNGVRAHHWNFGNMPPVEGVTDGDVKMIVRYIRELQKANGIY